MTFGNHFHCDAGVPSRGDVISEKHQPHPQCHLRLVPLQQLPLLQWVVAASVPSHHLIAMVLQDQRMWKM